MRTHKGYLTSYKDLYNDLNKDLDRDLNKEVNRDVKKDLNRDLNSDLNKDLNTDHKDLSVVELSSHRSSKSYSQLGKRLQEALVDSSYEVRLATLKVVKKQFGL